MHQQDPGQHPKQDFQVERLAFFSDAVFAIAITLLIIEFKVPHITKDSSIDSVLHDLLELRYNLFALLLSFYLISMYWMRHHFLFKHIHNYNKQVVALNLAMLLPIIFFPFTTALIAESFKNPQVLVLAMRLFMLNHILAGLALYGLFWLTIVRHRNLSYEMSPVEKVKFGIKVLSPTLFFIILFGVTLYKVTQDIFLIGLIIYAVLMKFFQWYFLKRARAVEGVKG